MRPREKNPSKGDWASETDKIICEFEINLSNEEIRKINTNEYKSLVKKKSEKAALKYLVDK